jgi:hypothetical protein
MGGELTDGKRAAGNRPVVGLHSYERARVNGSQALQVRRVSGTR